MKHTAELAVAYVLLENRRPKGSLYYCAEIFDAMRLRGFTKDQTFGAIENHAKEFRLAIVVMPGSRDGYGLDPDYMELSKFAPEYAELALGKQIYHFRNNGKTTWDDAEEQFGESKRKLQKRLNWYCKLTGFERPPDAKTPGRPPKNK